MFGWEVELCGLSSRKKGFVLYGCVLLHVLCGVKCSVVVGLIHCLRFVLVFKLFVMLVWLGLIPSRGGIWLFSKIDLWVLCLCGCVFFLEFGSGDWGLKLLYLDCRGGCFGRVEGLVWLLNLVVFVVDSFSVPPEREVWVVFLYQCLLVCCGDWR